MPEMTPFELRLGARLASELDAAVRPFDAQAIARTAMQGRRAMSPRRRLVLLAVTAVLFLGVTVAVGAGWIRIRVPQPPPWPLEGILAPAGSLTSADQVPMAAVLHDGRVLIVHAELSSNPNTPAEIWDPATRTSQRIGAQTKAADGSQLIVLQDGRVLLYGGDGQGWPPTAEIFDPASGTFSVLGSRPSTIDGTPILLADGRVLLSGGADVVDATAGENRGVSSRAEVFDPGTNRFTPVGDMHVRRQSHDMYLLKDGRVLVLGGASQAGGQTDAASAEIFDPATGSFALADRPPLATQIHDWSVRLANDRLMVLRQPGWGTFGDVPPRPMTVTFYDLETGAGTAGPTIPSDAPFYDVRTVTPLSESRVALFGFDKASYGPGEGGILDRGWIGVLDIDTGRLSAGIVREASWGTVVALRDGSLLVIGGVKRGDCDWPAEGDGVCMKATADVDILR